MGFFDFLKKSKTEKAAVETAVPTAAHPENEIKKGLETSVASSSIDLSMTAVEKDMLPKSTEADLIKIFAEFFAPNTELYTQIGTPAYTAYFDAIAMARAELLSNPLHFKKATKWTTAELAEMLNNPKPGITNMVLLGLIFRAGWYCVIESTCVCVDFYEKLPNCIALYLLLTAQKKPVEKRKQLIDSGDTSNLQQLSQAIDRLKVCDASWDPVILNTMF